MVFSQPIKILFVVCIDFTLILNYNCFAVDKKIWAFIGWGKNSKNFHSLCCSFGSPRHVNMSWIIPHCTEGMQGTLNQLFQFANRDLIYLHEICWVFAGYLPALEHVIRYLVVTFWVDLFRISNFENRTTGSKVRHFKAFQQIFSFSVTPGNIQVRHRRLRATCGHIQAMWFFQYSLSWVFHEKLTLPCIMCPLWNLEMLSHLKTESIKNYKKLSSSCKEVIFLFPLFKPFT